MQIPVARNLQHITVNILPAARRTFQTDMAPGTVVVAWDTETHLIAPGRQWPRMVCLSTCVGLVGDTGAVTFSAPGVTLANSQECLHLLAWMFTDPNVVMVLHNAPFDLLVAVEHVLRAVGAEAAEGFLRAVFRVLDEERVRDTWIRAPLLDNAKGFLAEAERGYNLAALAAPFDVALDKSGDSYRLRYAELEGVPVAVWPQAAVDYSAADALATAVVWGHQQESAAKHRYTQTALSGLHPKRDMAARWLGGAVQNEPAQVRGATALNLVGGWGIRTEREDVAKFRRSLEVEVSGYVPQLLATGVMRGADAAKPGSVDLKRLRGLVVEDAQQRGLPVPRNAPTDKMKLTAAEKGVKAEGNIAYDAETLEACRHPVLRMFTRFNHARKLLETYVPVLERGVTHPICPRYYPLMATGRTSSRNPNIQNLPRDPGVRQCYVPRQGFVFSSCDYSVLELRTFAEVCHKFGFKSGLRERFLAKMDPHTWFASMLLGWTYEETVAALKGQRGPEALARAEDMRQLAKAANFGYPGGLGAQSFRAYAWASYGVELTVEAAEALKQRWLRATPEAAYYFQAIGGRLGQTDAGTIPITQLYSGRRRGRCKFTQACNTLFQGLASDGAKEALYWTVREMLLDRGSELYGSRVAAFVHDEQLGEHPEENAGPAAQRMAEVMRECMELWTPNVPQEVKPTLMRRWDKKAKPVFNDEGQLVPWDSTGDALTHT